SRTLFTVQFMGDPGAVDRVRTAALDDYDGTLWTSEDTFLVAGHTLPKDPNLDHPRLVGARVSIHDLTGPYLPVVGWPVKVGAATTPYAKLVAIQDYLRKLPYSTGPQARPGHSYGALRRLFGSDSQDRGGYAEQHAAAFAVLARAQGFPTRVAVGYLLRKRA